MATMLGMPPLKLKCAWCDDVIREGREPISHGICPDCARLVKAGVNPQRWALPDDAELSGDWLDAFIATQLADVLSRRHFGVPYKQLSVEDRVKLSGECESFVARMTYRMQEAS